MALPCKKFFFGFFFALRHAVSSLATRVGELFLFFLLWRFIIPRQLSKQEMEDTWEFLPDGSLKWREGRKQVKAGDTAGCVNPQGYRVLTYSGSQYKVHRLVYAYHTGDWPRVIDHINGDRSDNRIENLRAVDHCTNNHNTEKSFGKSKYRGVSLLNGRPRAFVQYRGKREFLGYFNTEQEAHQAYRARRMALVPGIKLK